MIVVNRIVSLNIYEMYFSH